MGRDTIFLVTRWELNTGRKKNFGMPVALIVNQKDKGSEEMKFYIASYNGPDSDAMIYEKHGSEKDLYQLFPELKEVINRYRFKTIDFRLVNGDRLRIYDIKKQPAALW